VHGLRRGLCRGLFLQRPRRLPILQRSPHGPDRRVSRRLCHPARRVWQWVISVPKRLRGMLADRPALHFSTGVHSSEPGCRRSSNPRAADVQLTGLSLRRLTQTLLKRTLSKLLEVVRSSCQT
jgi:hypothetical protein